VTKALAQAKPSQSQAPIYGFGLAWGFRKPKPPQARPKLGLSGQAGPCTALCAMCRVREHRNMGSKLNVRIANGLDENGYPGLAVFRVPT